MPLASVLFTQKYLLGHRLGEGEELSQHDGPSGWVGGGWLNLRPITAWVTV